MVFWLSEMSTSIADGMNHVFFLLLCFIPLTLGHSVLLFSLSLIFRETSRYTEMSLNTIFPHGVFFFKVSFFEACTAICLSLQTVHYFKHLFSTFCFCDGGHQVEICLCKLVFRVDAVICSFVFLRLFKVSCLFLSLQGIAPKVEFGTRSIIEESDGRDSWSALSVSVFSITSHQPVHYHRPFPPFLCRFCFFLICAFDSTCFYMLFLFVGR